MGEAANLVVRARPVGTTGTVAEVDEVLVRQGNEALVQDRQASRARVEDPDWPCVHPADSRRAGGQHRRPRRHVAPERTTAGTR